MNTIQDLFNEVAEMIKLMRSGEHKGPMGDHAEVWEQAVLWYSYVLLRLSGHLVVHPEWAGELEAQLKKVEGCAAQKIPMVERFVFEKAGFA